MPPLAGAGALVVEILAAANKFASAPPNSELLWAVVAGGAPNIDAWVVCVVPNIEVWVLGVLPPKTEAWVVGMVAPNTEGWAVPPKTLGVLTVGEPNKEDPFAPNTDPWVVAVFAPNKLGVVVVALPKMELWVEDELNTLGVDVDVPKTGDWVVVVPNIDAVVAIVVANSWLWVVVAVGVPNTEVAFPAPNTDWVVVWVNADPKTDPDCVVPKTGVGDAGVGVLNTEGLGAVLLKTDWVVAVPNIELWVVEVVPKSVPCVDPNTVDVVETDEELNMESVWVVDFGWAATAAPNIEAASLAVVFDDLGSVGFTDKSVGIPSDVLTILDWLFASGEAIVTVPNIGWGFVAVKTSWIYTNFYFLKY